MNKFTISTMLLWLAAFFATTARAQVVVSLPTFPTVDDSVTIIFNPALGNGALVGTQVIYGH